MILKNYYFIALAALSKSLGRGKYYRKKLYSTRRILEKNFPKQSSFSFLQVGANDGVSFDFLYSFAIQRNISGIAIEPIEEYYLELCKNYSKYPEVICVNKAVHKTNSDAILYKIVANKIINYPDWVKGIASFDKAHLTKFEFIAAEDIQEDKVEASHLMAIIKETSLKKFDYFQIDTEGYDLEVLKMFSFSLGKPRMIKAEYVNLNTTAKKQIITLLKKQGYYTFFEGLDVIGMDLNRMKF